MCNITVVLTHHNELGMCNSSQLLQIIEKVRPEVIFEELSLSNFSKCYKLDELITVECSAIKQYVKNYEIKQVPVDTFPLPEDYSYDVGCMYRKLSNGSTYESQELCKLLDRQSQLIQLYGFPFLNSQENIKYFESFDILKEIILTNLNIENLFRIHRLEKEVVRKREFEIVENIYNFSKGNNYKTAMMFIGSGHGKSIFDVIHELEPFQSLKINWKRHFDHGY
jgi:hypothetical protein